MRIPSLAAVLCVPALLSAQAYHGQRLPQAFFAGNRARLMEQVQKAWGPGAVVVVKSMPLQVRSGDFEHPYRQDSDFYYLTGFEEPESVALLEPGAEKPYTLIVQPRDPKLETWTGRRQGTEGALKRFGADRAETTDKLKEVLDAALAKAKTVVLIDNFDEPFRDQVLRAVIPAGADNNHSRFRKALVDGRHLVAEMRLFKQPAEVEMMQKAVDASIQGHLAAMRESRPGDNEGQVAARFEGTVRGLGARFLAYPSIAGGGANGCILHYEEDDQPTRGGDLMLLDAGAEVGFYGADVTRTWPLSGRFTPEQRALYDLVYKAQEAGIALCRPGTEHKAIHEATSRIISDGLVDLGILKGDKDEVYKRKDWKRFFMHGTSHWLGLDVHDTGDYGQAEGRPKYEFYRRLEPGMVTTVEPGIYVPADAEGVDPKWRGLGVRIEDDVLVTAEGPRNLSGALPRKAEDVEKAVLAARKK